jgi:hypothetical protein
MSSIQSDRNPADPPKVGVVQHLEHAFPGILLHNFSTQTKCAVWRDHVAAELPDCYPSPSPSHPVDNGDDFKPKIVSIMEPLYMSLQVSLTEHI